MLNKPEECFDWIRGRIGYAQGAYWKYLKFCGDESKWRKRGFGFYWKIGGDNA